MLMTLDEAMMLCHTHEQINHDGLWRPEMADDLVDAVVQDMVGLVAGKFDGIGTKMSFTRDEGDCPTRWTVQARVGWNDVELHRQFLAIGIARTKMSAAFACVRDWDQKRQKLLEKKDEP